MAAAIFEYEATELESITTSGRIGFCHTPAATPAPLLVSAPSTPVTAVPCPRVSATLLLLVTKFQPGRSRPARSGCPVSTPESSTAMGEELPVVRSHAAGAWIFGQCHCSE